jgi:hypothetical protein
MNPNAKRTGESVRTRGHDEFIDALLFAGERVHIDGIQSSHVGVVPEMFFDCSMYNKRPGNGTKFDFGANAGSAPTASRQPERMGHEYV